MKIIDTNDSLDEPIEYDAYGATTHVESYNYYDGDTTVCGDGESYLGKTRHNRGDGIGFGYGDSNDTGGSDIYYYHYPLIARESQRNNEYCLETNENNKQQRQ